MNGGWMFIQLPYVWLCTRESVSAYLDGAIVYVFNKQRIALCHPIIM